VPGSTARDPGKVLVPARRLELTSDARKFRRAGDCAMLSTVAPRAALVVPFGEKAFWVAGFIAACAMAVAMLAVGFLVILPIGGLVLWVYLYSRLRRRDDGN